MGASRTRIDPASVRRTMRDAGLRARHSLSQNFLADTDVLEVSTPELDDVVRLEDRYGRAGT